MFLQPDLHREQLRTGATDGSVLSILDTMMHNPAQLRRCRKAFRTASRLTQQD